jgi:hypothetical protein
VSYTVLPLSIICYLNRCLFYFSSKARVAAAQNNNNQNMAPNGNDIINNNQNLAPNEINIINNQNDFDVDPDLDTFDDI